MEFPKGITVTPLRMEGNALMCEVTATDEAVAAIVAERWTPERIAAMRRVVEAARRFVECADEFIPREGEWFYPDALGEYSEALDDAIAAEARAWEEPAAKPELTPIAWGGEHDGW